jgi:cyclopropane fatty-acyl-phospholipid synthase-like methyltransferase
VSAAKPFSAACERNRDPILDVLRSAFADRRRVLEIGSGTGQHAVHFAGALPHLRWQCSDRTENLPGIQLWLEEAALLNTPPPLTLDVLNDVWPEGHFDAAYSANTLHIMGWPAVQAMFNGLGQVLASDARLLVYGPFRRGGEHTSASNAQFDAQLRAQSSWMGVRDLEAVDALAAGIGLQLLEIHPMPANNLCLHWRRRS